MVTLQFGKDIASAVPDKLEKIDLDRLADRILKPFDSLDLKTAQLRRVGGIDAKAYQTLKKDLPYVTCGIFNPPNRRTENFATIQCFFLDFDHLSEKETNPDALKKQLEQDDRIALMFTSPGGDGLKVLFVLKTPFTDYGKYTLFYKVFASEFARSLGLQQVIDKRTSDATRATFLCYDPEAWYNPLFKEVEADHYIDFDSALQVDEAMELGKQQAQEFKDSEKERKSNEAPEEDLPDELLEDIKRKLNPSFKPKRKEKHYIVPEKVNLLEDELKGRCSELGIEIVESHPIQYGKQLVFSAGEHKGELNIFFGKRGFSVVKSAKSLCSSELNDIAYQLVMELIES